MALANGSPEEDRRPGRILASLAPQLMSQRIVGSPSFQAVKPLVDPAAFDAQATLRGIARSRMMLPTAWGGRETATTTELVITDAERIAELLRMDLTLEGRRRSIQAGDAAAQGVDLLAGFRATVPSASEAKHRRRQKRAGLGQQALGLEDDELGDLGWRGAEERGLLTAEDERDGGVGRRKSTPGGLEARKARKARRQTALGLASAAPEGSSATELRSELDEIALDRAHLATKRQLLAADRDAVDALIARYQALRVEIDRKMLALKEEELELIDEEEGVLGRLDGLEAQRVPSTSRRRKGPAFLPSSHDALPRSTAFLTLAGHTDALTALDFSCPYGSLLTSSLDSTVRLWDLTNGEEVSRLKGHRGIVNCLQVEGSVAVTGSRDNQLIVWDLEKADEGEEGAEVMRLSGHAGSVTALYLDGTRLVSGAEDRTLREWNIETGQVVSTLDVLWAMQHTVSPTASPPASPFTTPSVSPIRPRLKARGSLGPPAGSLEYLPPLDPSWEDSQDDFIGGLQHYGAALATGDRSAVIRLWDLRTGQSVRTLIGHTGAIRCLAFDETTLMSGGADHSLKIWDLRTGGILDTLRFDHPVTALQFDTRKIVFAAGENGVRVHNRTTLQQAQLVTNGHSAPVGHLRYDDTFLVTGSRDGTAKAWAM